MEKENALLSDQQMQQIQNVQFGQGNIAPLGIDENKFPLATSIGPGVYWVKARNPMPGHPFADSWQIANIYEWDGKLIHMECGSPMIQVLTPQFCSLFDWVQIEAPGTVVTKIPKEMIRLNATPMPMEPQQSEEVISVQATPDQVKAAAPTVMEPGSDNVVSFPK